MLRFFNIEINFTLSDDEFKLLTDSIQEGEKSHEATVGQFWYGNMNRRQFCSNKKEECFLSATTRQMDVVILKSLEKFVTFSNVGPYWKLGAELYEKLYKVLKNAIDLANGLNTHSATKDIK